MRNVLLIQLTGLILLSSTLWAEIQVNTRTPYGQTYPDIAIDVEGNYVVVWRSYRQDGSSGSIHFQRFDATGLPVGEETQVNTETAGDQTEPTVSANPEGGFVVAWHGPGPNGLDVFARLFDTNGEPLAEEFRVNATTAGTQRYPRVAMLGNGSFVVVWQNEMPGVNAYNRAGAFQVFDAQGLCIGQETQFSESLDCRHPDVAANGMGGFVIVWMQDKGGNSIQTRLYDNDALALTEPCKVNDVYFTSVTKPRVAMNRRGTFVVAWDGHGEYASLDDIHARIFDPNANAIGEQFLVNTTSDGKQECPHISISATGSFVIIWDTDYKGHGKDILGQMFDSNGVPAGPEFCPHVCLAEDQKHAAVAMSDSDSFFAVWQSYKQDGSDCGIFGMLGPSNCQGDFTGDAVVNFRDFALMTNLFCNGEHAPVYDINADGRIDLSDVEMLCAHWLGR